MQKRYYRTTFSVEGKDVILVQQCLGPELEKANTVAPNARYRKIAYLTEFVLKNVSDALESAYAESQSERRSRTKART